MKISLILHIKDFQVHRFQNSTTFRWLKNYFSKTKKLQMKIIKRIYLHILHNCSFSITLSITHTRHHSLSLSLLFRTAKIIPNITNNKIFIKSQLINNSLLSKTMEELLLTLSQSRITKVESQEEPLIMRDNNNTWARVQAIFESNLYLTCNHNHWLIATASLNNSK
jgi:hypothetical protein